MFFFFFNVVVLGAVLVFIFIFFIFGVISESEQYARLIPVFGKILFFVFFVFFVWIELLVLCFLLDEKKNFCCILRDSLFDLFFVDKFNAAGVVCTLASLLYVAFEFLSFFMCDNFSFFSGLFLFLLILFLFLFFSPVCARTRDTVLVFSFTFFSLHFFYFHCFSLSY